MIVPPDITVLLIFTACFITAVYFVDRKIEKDKNKLEQKTKHL